MGFYNEKESLFNNEKIDNSFNLECLGQSAVVISGYKLISKLSETEMVISVKNNKKIVISGVKLYIKRLEKMEVVIAGTILNIGFN